MKNPLEKTLYPIVARWTKHHFHCFITKTTTGTLHSHADVVGVRDLGGDLSGDVETIVVEVKRGQEAFATASGQTYGYNVCANLVYLADKRAKNFTLDELQIARHLGIGLIQIRNNKCHEILSSPFYNPIRGLNLLLLEQMGLGRCQFCGCIFQIGVEKKHSNLTREKVLNALNSGKGLVFWNDEVSKRKERYGVRRSSDGFNERRFVCPDCVQNLLGVEPNRLKRWFSQYGHGG